MAEPTGSSGMEQESVQDFLHLFGVSGIQKGGSVVGWSTLGFGTAGWLLPLMGRMFRATGRKMLEMLKGTFNIARHGDFAGACFAIPVECEATMAFGITVGAANV
jgi:hypothetical protein